LDLRIVSWELKLAYVLGAWTIWIPIRAILNAFGTPTVDVSVANVVVSLAGFLLGARVFRGRGEPIAPPRPWWKMTARPTLSRRLGYLFVYLTISSAYVVVANVLGIARFRRTHDGLTELVISTLLSSVVAFLYLNSAVRLAKADVLPLEPKFKPASKIR
jgi:hypothetical protein